LNSRFNTVTRAKINIKDSVDFSKKGPLEKRFGLNVLQWNFLQAESFCLR